MSIVDERVKLIDYKDKTIIYLDLSGLQGDVMVEIVRRFEKLVLESENPISLTNFIGASVYGDGLEEIKRVAKVVRPHIVKRAVVGITGVKAVLYKSVNLLARGVPTKIFDNIEDAKEYLVK